MDRTPHVDARPSLELQTVTDNRLELVRELDGAERWGSLPPATRVARIAGWTLSLSMAVIGLAYVAMMMLVR